MKVTPILLLTGYLGSGKTTLVNHILANERGIRFAVIVNDIGEVNIDASLIERGGVVGQDDESLVALQNGCICCTLKMDLVKQIEEIMAMQRFDYIVIEASGICEPAPIAQTICSIPYMGDGLLKNGTPKLDCIVTVVDALRLQDEFGCGEALQADRDEDDIENLIVEQIEFCNIVILNKISEISDEDRRRVKAVIRALRPGVEIIDADYADVDLSRIINTGMFDFNQVATSAAWVKGIEGPSEDHELHHDHHDHHHHHDDDEEADDHDHDHDEEEHHHHDHNHHDHDHGPDCHCSHCEGHSHGEEYGISSFVYFRRPGFDLNKFDFYAARKWPRSIIRCKGICYFSTNPDMSYLFESAGKQKQLKEAGMWYATAPEEELKEFMEKDPSIMRDWDPDYCDRMVKLVFIGRDMDRGAITKALDDCLDR